MMNQQVPLAADGLGSENRGGSAAVAEAGQLATSCMQRAILRDAERWPSSHRVMLGLWCEGDVDAAALARAWLEVQERHPVLRSRFFQAGGEWRRRPGPPAALRALALPGEELPALVARASAELARPFDLAVEPPVAGVFLEGRGGGLLAWALHHVVYDAVAILVFIEELRAVYRRATGEEAAAAPPMRFEAFVDHERAQLAEGRREAMLEAWRASLDGRPLRQDFGRRSFGAPEDWAMTGEQRAEVPVEVARGLGRRSRAAGTSFHPALLAAWFLALREETGEQDLVAGTSVSLRSPEHAFAIGPLINFVPVRARLDGADYGAALERTAAAHAAASERTWLPIGELVEAHAPAAEAALLPRLGLNHNVNFYDIGALGVLNAARERAAGVAQLGRGVTVREVPIADLGAVRPYDLTCGIWRVNGALRVGVNASQKLLGGPFARRMLERFVRILHAAASEES
jgi:hypothetical protein